MRMAESPIELFFWPTPNGYKIVIMLEECGLSYAIRMVDITKGNQFDPAFLNIAPNNRIPAIIDPDGPDGKPISIFESGAILQYLGRKTGKLYPKDERSRVEVDQWLHWQIGGLGPMAGQAHHFRQYAPKKIQYGLDRYTDEVNRLYGVLNHRLADRDYLVKNYSIADIASQPWVRMYRRQGQDMAEFPNIEAWLLRIKKRPAVIRAMEIGKAERHAFDLANDEKAKRLLFGQRAR